jgi:hypothetical protein
LTRSYTVDGSLQSTINFDQKLSAGVYMIEMTNAGQIQTQCLVVQ